MPEAPRWHGDALLLSNIWDGKVLSLDLDGHVQVVAAFPEEYASGLGVLPNGDLVVVLMKSRRIVRVNASRQQHDYADLSQLTPFHINDMIVGPGGRAYVSQPGSNLFEGVMPGPTDILIVEPDGVARIGASGLSGPNGLAISPDGRRLYIAESTACRISTLDIADDGSLSNLRVFGDVPEEGFPDGICLDDEGGVWAAIPYLKADMNGFGVGVIRMVDGGEVTHRVPMNESYRALACVFGGEDRRSLFICTTNEVHPHDTMVLRSGRVERLDVEFRGGGHP